MTKEQINELICRHSFPFPSRQAELIETHISWLILTDDYAYKIKKPIDYGFLDFSTLEKRRYYCRRELILNSRLTSGMYLDVMPITRTESGPVIGSTGAQVIDYALLMRRMDESKQMDHLLKQNRLTREHLYEIAVQVADFHRGAIVEPGGGSPAQLKERFADLLSVNDFIIETLGKSEASMIRDIVGFADCLVERYAQRIRRREQEGWVIDGHGDLHSKNILLLEEPVIFDCIEFNDDLRCVDMLNEVGFFCMDLEYYGYRRAAQTFLSDYLNRIHCMPEAADLQLFRFFKAYRANVRLKVNCLRAMQADAESDRVELMPVIHDYFSLLKGYYLELKTDTN